MGIIETMAKRIQAEDLEGLLMTPQEVAKELGVGSPRVRQLAKDGELKSVRTETGYRIFLRPDVEEMKKRREEKSR